VSGVWCRHDLSKAEEIECQNFGLGVRPCLHTYSQAPSHLPDCSEWFTFLCGFLGGWFCKTKMDTRLQLAGMTEGRKMGRRTKRRSMPDTGVQVGIKRGNDHVTNNISKDTCRCVPFTMVTTPTITGPLCNNAKHLARLLDDIDVRRTYPPLNTDGMNY
jgi:hypothetical protein